MFIHSDKFRNRTSEFIGTFILIEFVLIALHLYTEPPPESAHPAKV